MGIGHMKGILPLRWPFFSNLLMQILGSSYVNKHQRVKAGFLHGKRVRKFFVEARSRHFNGMRVYMCLDSFVCFAPLGAPTPIPQVSLEDLAIIS